MIDEIQVENLALIESAQLRPCSGMTVLTGETGAGKTALVSAVKLLMGERSDKGAVREGAAELAVSGRFFTRASAASDEELVVVRTVRTDGRSRMSMNGRMASAAEVRTHVAPLVDLCGQHEHQRLMHPAEHLHMLDAWAGAKVSSARAAYEAAYDATRQAQAQLDHVREASAASSAKLDEARFACKRIGEVNPAEGEYETLSAELSRAEHAESLFAAAKGAHEALSGDAGVLDGLNAAAAALSAVACYDESLSAYAASLREAGYIIEDVSRDVCSYADSVEFDEATLRGQQERMAALQGLLRSYGPRMQDVLDVFERSRELVSLVDDAAQRERAAQEALDACEADLVQAAAALACARSKVAPCFAAQVSLQMERLQMGGAQLECALHDLPRDKWTRAGSQLAEFLFRPGAGMAARPLARIASGGEVSRVMLACKVVLGEHDEVETLVFDEVDAGVGGQTAVALADVLADLAKSHQVIVITHLPQVAVRADAHYAVRKVEGDVPRTELAPLDSEARVCEVARMLSGSCTAASLAHARELLEPAASEAADTSELRL